MDEKAYELIEKLGEKLQIGTTEIVEAYTQYMIGSSIAWMLFGIALTFFSWRVYRGMMAMKDKDRNSDNPVFSFCVVFVVISVIIGVSLITQNLATLLAPKGAAIRELIQMLAK